MHALRVAGGLYTPARTLRVAVDCCGAVPDFRPPVAPVSALAAIVGKGDAFCLGDEWITEYLDPWAGIGIDMDGGRDIVCLCNGILFAGRMAI